MAPLFVDDHEACAWPVHLSILVSMSLCSVLVMTFGIIMMVFGIGVQFFGFASLSLINDNHWTRLIPDMYSWILIAAGLLLACVACSTFCIGCNSKAQKSRCFLTLILVLAITTMLLSTALFVMIQTDFYLDETINAMKQTAPSGFSQSVEAALQGEYTAYIK